LESSGKLAGFEVASGLGLLDGVGDGPG
jgi:hypothetical protein